jgi:hypothetical protein
MRGDTEMIGGIISSRKTKEYSLERRAGDYGSSRGRKNAVKYRSTVTYSKILEPDMFQIKNFFRTLDVEYGV